MKDPSPEFLKYLETDPKCQEAVDRAFSAQATEFHELLSQLKDARATPHAFSKDKAFASSSPAGFPRPLWAALILVLLGTAAIGAWVAAGNKNEVASLRLAASEREEVVHRLESAQAEKERELAKANEEVARLRVMLPSKGIEAPGNVAALKQKIDSLKEQLAASRSTSAKHEKDLVQAKAKLMAREEELKSQITENQTLREDTAKLAKEIAEARRSALIVATYWCSVFRNQPFPNKARLPGLLLQGTADEYLAYIAGDLRGQDKVMLKSLPNLPSTSPWASLAKAEFRLQAEGNADEILKILAETEAQLMRNGLPATTHAALSFMAHRGTAYQAAARSLHLRKNLPPSLLAALKSEKPEYRAAAALLLAESDALLTNEGSEALQAIRADPNPYLKAVGDYAFQRISSARLTSYPPKK